MKSRQNIVNALVLIAALSPIAYLLFVWDALPETILIRFTFDEPTEAEQSRQAFLFSTILLSLTAAGLYFLMRNLQKIDPKVKAGKHTSGFNRIGLSATIFIVLLNYFIVLTAAYSWDVSQKIIFMFGALILAVLGNYMNNIKPNFFAGLRLPWTLSDENNWRQTHQLAGKLWFWGGIVLALFTLLLPEISIKPLFIGSLVLLILIPSVYSYRLFKNKRDNSTPLR